MDKLRVQFAKIDKSETCHGLSYIVDPLYGQLRVFCIEVPATVIKPISFMEGNADHIGENRLN